MSLNALPYDLLFNIAQYLSIDDIHNLQATCKSLRVFTLTRPVYRALAHGLLARSRPLPLPAFQRLSDLSTKNLIKAVDRAHNFERAWRIRAPRPARSPFSLSTSSSTTSDRPGQWYTKISAPPNEEIDWLSPITSSYTLCATKSGRVICWDVARDACLAEWDPRTLSEQRDSGEPISKDDHKMDRRKSKEDDDDDDDDDQEQLDSEKKWELWKCRVEFEERAVYFTMARVLEGSYDDNRVMEFVLMKLAFPPEVRDCPSPLCQSLTLIPDPHRCSPLKSPANSPPPSSQGSSPQDSTFHASSASTDSSYPARSPLSTRTLSPLPESDREIPTLTVFPGTTPSTYSTCPGGRFVRTRSTLRAGTLFETSSQSTFESKPVFFPLTSFHTTGVVMNVFLLDPPRRLLSAFVWVASSNTIALYVLLDWAKDEYVFVDTGVSCLISSNWSCILHEDQIVIHSEEADAAYQHFYPLNILRNFVKLRKPSLLAARIHNQDNQTDHHSQQTFSRDELPAISIRLSPMRSISRKFVFPSVQSPSIESVDPDFTTAADEESDEEPPVEEQPHAGSSQTIELQQESEVDDNDGLLDDSSGSSTEDDERWSQQAVADSSRSKGKGRADGVNEDTVDEYEPGLSSRRAKNKGKMREADAEQDQTATMTQVRSSSASHQVSPDIDHASPSVPPAAPPLVESHSPPTSSPAQNPYPFPPWYPESAHFVRQWWPTLPGVPRLSCTVVLLAAHDPNTHRTRFVLAQHYFRVPIVREPSTSHSSASNSHTNGDGDDEMLHLWYVSTPFEVVCVLDSAGDSDDDEEASERPRPLVAVDFGHAVWIEHAADSGADLSVDAGNASFSDSDDDGEHDDETLSASMSGGAGKLGSASNTTGCHHDLPRSAASDSTGPQDGDDTSYDSRRRPVPKCLRFVTFPPVFTAGDRKAEKPGNACAWREEAVVRTLEIPDELDLDGVETINIDQSQGAVILSVKEGKIFILRYE
ncbi:hypothetical protein JVU11DRAFT_11679 [Chiua virens]|nr:hypothetical protein JVU11DRAFT_11679 [Chiua virens]